MGVPRFVPSEIPIVTNIQREFINQPINILGKILRSTALNTGSTHTVVFVDEPVDDLNFFKFSPPFENDPIFPERTSVLWTHQIEDARFAVRIWERGAGETLGCGTGACAAAVAAVVTGRAKRNEPIMITSKGGELSVVWSDTIWMTGPSVLVFDGEINE